MLKIQSFTFSPIQENTYILYNEFKHCIIIDPGCYDDAEKESLKAYITAQDLLPVMLVNSHCHLDHVFGNKFVAETYGLDLQIHEKEQPLLAYAPTSGLMYNLAFDNYQGPLSFLKEGDNIILDDDVLHVIEAPGHSPGSICFYCARQDFLIGGDVLFRGSIGRTDLPMGDHDTLLKSIREKLFILPAATMVYPGHGPATSIGEEKRSNPFFAG